MPDGPDKTIWGREQLAWLKESILASDAAFRVLISPTPIVGPDRATALEVVGQACAHGAGGQHRDEQQQQMERQPLRAAGFRG